MQLDCYSNNLTSLNVENCNKCPAVRAFDNKIEIRDANIDTNTLQGFDIRKASDWVNAVIEGTVVRAIDPEKEITYKYDCGGANLNNFAFIPPGRIYTVHFDARGGNCSIENKLVAYDTSYGVLPTPTRTGYTFNGWLDSIAPNQDHHFIREGTIYKKTADSTLYASWAVKLYKVTFDAMGGRCCKEYMFTSYYSGSSLWYDYLPVPTREGYTFAGWFDASTGGNLVEHGTKYTKTTDSTLYAHWLANQYIVTFDAAGGSCTVKNISVKYGTPFGTLPAVTRDGYSFDGWYLQPEGEAAYKITPETIVAITTGSTAYAHWRKNPVPTPKPAPNHISGGGTSGGHNSAAAPQTASFQKKKSVIRAKIAGAGKIKLTWKKIKGASKYSIYYKTSAKGKYKLLKAVRKTSYTVPKLKSSKKYYFKVKGSAVIGGRTVFTQFSKAVFKKAVGKPPTPKLSGSMKGNILILNWGKLKGISKIVIDRKVGNTRYKRFKTGNGKGIGYVKKLEDYNPSQKYSFRIRICYLKDGVEIWSSSSNSVIL